MTEIAVRPQTREQWLELAVLKLRSLFDEIAVPLPAVRVSVGWPSKGGTGTKKKVIGQCWKSIVAGDGIAQLFISPVLGDDVVKLLGVLLHELVHASDDCESGHKGVFADRAHALGLIGKMTATEVGPNLGLCLSDLITELGPYPHSALNLLEMEKQRPPQTTRMIKVVCLDDGYTIRTTQKWLDVGLPTCPCGAEMDLPA